MMYAFAKDQAYAGPQTSKRQHAKILLDALKENKPHRWNRWRKRNANIRPDLRGVNLWGRFLYGLDLSNCRLDDAELVRTDLRDVNLSKSSLNGASLTLSNLADAICIGTEFRQATLTGAYLGGASLRGCCFHNANLSSATLTHADLSGATLVDTSLESARLDRTVLANTVFRNCELNHASFLDARLEGTRILDCSASYVNAKRIHIGKNVVQRNLTLGNKMSPVYGGLFLSKIRTDDLRVASFIGELEKPDALSHLINAGTDYLVLILGRFSRGSREVLDTVQKNCWSRGRIPLVFDFEGPRQRRLVDAVRVFACMAEFVIADLTNPKSVPLELDAIVPQLAIPVVPLIKDGQVPFAMFADLRHKYPWVLPAFSYRTTRQIDRQFDAVLEMVLTAKEAISERSGKNVSIVVPISAASRLAMTQSGKATIPKKRKKF
jgi:hypothetical protein